ncbi:hypothetical protein [Paenibacillus sp. V4I7]|uniref:hypothetical protein n=1 Tax=Paenibacillus sp. V4I7 TaxID=3042307 RepID=UPI0027874828|nr:hypothetical protein [Paenibacillus sp. V4I7]MDQ0899130.1 hypothetical protein [Paenibacillus sp. V4I7]
MAFTPFFNLSGGSLLALLDRGVSYMLLRLPLLQLPKQPLHPVKMLQQPFLYELCAYTARLMSDRGNTTFHL